MIDSMDKRTASFDFGSSEKGFAVSIDFPNGDSLTLEVDRKTGEVRLDTAITWIAPASDGECVELENRILEAPTSAIAGCQSIADFLEIFQITNFLK